MVTVVKVKYPTSYPAYDFLTDIEGIKKGDSVVVESSHGLGLVTVIEADILPESSKATRWVVCKVDLTAHVRRMEKEKKLKELKKQMDSRRKKIEDVEIYSMLAKKDTEMQVMLDEYLVLSAEIR